MHHREHAAAIAERLAREETGALGVALVGSVAAGTDHPDSDIDLIVAAATDPGVRVTHVEGRMATLTRKTPADLAAAFSDPAQAPAAVPAWRSARILTDPGGHLAAVQARALAWTWEQVGAGADDWAAGQLVGLAE
ncbi:nucleotidyltransferase domain-containing protein [Glycomyces paridis]|uniref:Nucleotidyltransferase domain-containing protein n=1 Tax=Glycomyces paridis TaxID=2126555 RepID=A0A4S8PD88_9ACTN|nr:nucleotidyltransferase domain-containing protein [Glycomyces paridis]THV26234.1 nucleotidyltransferase domain-containing protein [Glycomyces paridis]